MTVLDIQFFIITVPIFIGLVILYRDLNKKPKNKPLITEANSATAHTYWQNKMGEPKQRKQHNEN